MNEDFITYVESRLQQWAEWCCSGNWYGLGYPSYSTMYRIMTEGVLINAAGHKEISVDKEAEEIEALVVELATQNEQLAMALRIGYLSDGSMRCKARKFKISRDKLSRLLDMARQWLAGRLSAS